MGKKKSPTVEELAAYEIPANLKINVITNASVDFSPCAFGSDFLNWKNYINSDLEKMKKEICPRLGTLVQDREGNKYRFTDIRMEEKTVKDGAAVPTYIFDLMIVQG